MGWITLGVHGNFSFLCRAGGNWSWRYTPEMLSPPVIEQLRILTELYGRAPKQEPATEDQEPGTGEEVSG